ncbi:MAG: antirestriction protein ArdA [Corynebacterium sp.]|uniref:antirestriction protein ArdA n=1 Tax=Corynebacterium sp. TaxID=1720 RepID=UPI003F936807
MKTFNPATDTITPRVWVGCLTCYYDGALVGHWYDVIDAASVLPQDIHGIPTDHEELWVMDHENLPTIPGSPKMDPLTATAWTEVIEAISPQWRTAYLAWIEDRRISTPAETPGRDEFFGFFAGEYANFTDYADGIVCDTGMLSGVPEDVAQYFDLERYAADLAHDYTVIDTPDYNVCVFANH